MSLIKKKKVKVKKYLYMGDVMKRCIWKCIYVKWNFLLYLIEVFDYNITRWEYCRTLFYNSLRL